MFLHAAVKGSQLSLVQGFASSQLLAAPPTQLPPLQVSPWLHASPSLHGVLLFTYAHLPVLGSHESLVQRLPSSQLTVDPARHEPPWQTSACVHGFLSSHAAVLAMEVHVPLWVSQESVVHGLPSSQTLSAPATHWPPAQASLSVQALLSVQGAVLFVLLHVPPAQTSVVQGLPSSQFLAVPGWH